jgi:hypothetical protein
MPTGRLARQVEHPAAFEVIESPSQGEVSGLSGVKVLSSTSMWAVGMGAGPDNQPRTLIEAWDGAKLQVASSPNLTDFENELQAVDATAPDDVWAVGYANTRLGTNGLPTVTLIEHFDGRAWSIVRSPNPGGGLVATLYGVKAVAPSDAWAVGWYYGAGNVSDALILHWDGTAWTHVEEPDADSNRRLNAIAGVASRDLWAVGWQDQDGGGQASYILHWDGTSWQRVPSPNPPGAHSTQLYGVSALSASDVWAVGYSYTRAADVRSAVILHWDGRAWNETSANAPSNATLLAVAASSARDVWTVGYENPQTGFAALVEHWDGTAWTPRPVPSPGLLPSLYSVSAAAGTVFAVGSQGEVEGLLQHPLVMRTAD